MAGKKNKSKDVKKKSIKKASASKPKKSKTNKSTVKKNVKYKTEKNNKLKKNATKSNSKKKVSDKNSKPKTKLKISSNSSKAIKSVKKSPSTKEQKKKSSINQPSGKKTVLKNKKTVRNLTKKSGINKSSTVLNTKKVQKSVDWKSKYSFDEKEKAGKESIKDTPALIIEPKENQPDIINEEKIKDITSSVTSPKYTTSFLEAKTDKEPDGKFEMEFMVRCSPDLLFDFLYTPSGLSEWFCDDVNIRNGVYTFNWNGEISQARLLKMVEGERVRYQWTNRTDGAYFEFRIVKDELTGDVSLFITDFADPSWDIEGGKRLWQQQIEKLLKLIGSLY